MRNNLYKPPYIGFRDLFQRLTEYLVSASYDIQGQTHKSSCFDKISLPYDIYLHLLRNFELKLFVCINIVQN